MDVNNTCVPPLAFDGVDFGFKEMAALAQASKQWQVYMAGRMRERLFEELAARVPFLAKDGWVCLEDGYDVHLQTLHLVPGQLLKALELLEKLEQRRKRQRFPKDLDMLFDKKLFAPRGRPATAFRSMSTIHTINFFLLLAARFDRTNTFVQVCIFTVMLGYMARDKGTTALILNPRNKFTDALLVNIADALHTSKKKRYHHVVRKQLEKCAGIVKTLVAM